MAEARVTERLPPLQGTAGRGVTVAVVTPAAYAHPWFGDRVSGGLLTVPTSELVHGTAVVGLVLQRAPAAEVWVEAVPEAATGSASSQAWAEAMGRIGERRPDVALLPFGSDHPDPALGEAVRRLVAQGSAVVAAAGNDARPSLSFPASLESVVAVAGMQYEQESRTWVLAPFTNHGDGVVTAPGVDLLTTTVSTDGDPADPPFGRLSGTSMAAALVAGEVAAEIGRSGARPAQAAARVATMPPGAFLAGLAWAPPESRDAPEQPGAVDPAATDDDGDRWELADARTVVNDNATTEDRLGYDVYRDAVVTFLQDPNTLPPLTVGIKGKWGSGKTSLMRMIRVKLDPPERVEGDAMVPRTIPLVEGSQQRLSTYAGRRRPGVRRVLRLLRGRRDALVHTTPGASGARTTGLQARPPEGTDDGWRPTVWFNPWMYQTGDQVWAGLAHEIIRQVTDRMSVRDRERFWLALNLSRVDGEAVRRRIYTLALERFVPAVVGLLVAVGLTLAMAALARVLDVSLAADALRAVGGVAVIGALGTGLVRVLMLARAPAGDVLPAIVSAPEAGQLAASTTAAVTTGLLAEPAYGQRLGLLHLVRTDVSAVLDLVATPERPLVVFVDDLDRCSHGTVSQVVEALNLFVAGQFRNCVFVVAMEPEAVAASIEAAYERLAASDRETADPGRPSVGWRFLDKLVQLPISLPALDEIVVGGLLRSQIADPDTPSSGGPTAEERAPQFQQQVRAYEALLSSSSSVENVSTSSKVLTASAIDVDEEAVREAVRRVVRHRLQADDPQVAAIVDDVVGDVSWNPREIKRFVNLLRFYALVAQEREFRDPEHRLRLEALSRMALLAIRWPHLRGRFVTPVDAGGTVLSVAESVLRANTDPATLESELLESGVPQRFAATVLAEPDLQDVLKRGPVLGAQAVGYL